MDLGLKGRVALVAAASRGLGRACALAFAREGADVAICARGGEDLERTAGEIRATGVLVWQAVADLAQPGECERFVAGAVQALGRADVVITNAGGPPAGSVAEFDDDQFRAALEANFLTAVRLARAALPHMRRERWGRIVNIASYTVKQPAPGLGLSNSARTALVGWAKTLSNEVAAEGVTVNTVAPGPILTDRIRSLAAAAVTAEGISEEEALARFERDIPMGRVGRPEEFAAVVVFLASEAASFVTGTVLQVDGGAVRALM